MDGKVAIITGGSRGIGAGLVAGYRRVRLLRHPGQRRLTGHHPDPVHPPGSYEHLGDQLPPLERACDVVDGILFLEFSPYITGEIVHIDGGQVAGH
jgi:NAD(P)-dependent dehydrogenase (short-subunit alcohol dehydrogenase family)